MKINRQLAALALLSILHSHLSTCHAQGTLTPPGVPTANMKSLAQIEPRTPISSAPYTISAPGSYYLTTNLTATVSNAIVVTASGVTLDLGGFTISSTVPDANNGGNAILLSAGLNGITIRNGHIRGGVTNNGSGSYAGSGFAGGVYCAMGNENVLVSGVSVSGCLSYGIDLRTGASTVVEFCAVQTVGGTGIIASTVKGVIVRDCGGDAMFVDQASDSHGEASSSGTGINANQLAQNCYGSSASGTGVGALQALNCYGTTTSGYAGVTAATAQNCEGFNYGSSYGIFATSAQNCYGHSNAGAGIYAPNGSVFNCYGESSSGFGISANIAAFSIGERPGGTAIQSYIGNCCYAAYGTNNIVFKYNMP